MRAKICTKKVSLRESLSKRSCCNSARLFVLSEYTLRFIYTDTHIRPSDRGSICRDSDTNPPTDTFKQYTDKKHHYPYTPQYYTPVHELTSCVYANWRSRDFLHGFHLRTGWGAFFSARLFFHVQIPYLNKSQRLLWHDVMKLGRFQVFSEFVWENCKKLVLIFDGMQKLNLSYWIAMWP